MEIEESKLVSDLLSVENLKNIIEDFVIKNGSIFYNGERYNRIEIIDEENIVLFRIQPKSKEIIKSSPIGTQEFFKEISFKLNRNNKKNEEVIIKTIKKEIIDILYLLEYKKQLEYEYQHMCECIDDNYTVGFDSSWKKFIDYEYKLLEFGYDSSNYKDKIIKKLKSKIKDIIEEINNDKNFFNIELANFTIFGNKFLENIGEDISEYKIKSSEKKMILNNYIKELIRILKVEDNNKIYKYRSYSDKYSSFYQHIIKLEEKIDKLKKLGGNISEYKIELLKFKKKNFKKLVEETIHDLESSHNNFDSIILDTLDFQLKELKELGENTLEYEERILKLRNSF